LEIARNLFKRDIEIYWICPNIEYYERLKTEWGENNVLYIGLSAITTSDLAYKDFPQDLQDIRSNDLVVRDRVLKFNTQQGSLYLKKLKYVVYNFLEQNSISCVFGEVTWSHEVVINRICRFVNSCKSTYFNPHTLRIPQQTFGFFLDEFQSTLSKHKNAESVDPLMLERYTASMLDSSIDIPLPDYLKLNDIIISKNNKLTTKILRLLNVFIGNVDKEDPTLEGSKIRRIIAGIKVFMNAKLYQIIKKVSIADVHGKDFFLYPLHKQPEASVDVIGKYYDNQLLNIRNIASQLKDNEYLVVKEHSNAIGDRSFNFYKQLMSYPRVILVDEKVDTKALIDISLGVFTISGTAALEASLKGVNSFCFSDVYFRHLKNCNIVTINDFNKFLSSDVTKSKSSNSLTKEEFVSEMLLSACNGVISNPNSDIRCVDPQNIANVADEFYDVIKY
jgi:hypothetical protein